MKNLVNLTQHEINVYNKEKTEILFSVQPNGVVPRVSTSQDIVDEINGVEVRKTTYGEVQDMPEEKENTIYIVSQMVLARLIENGRTDSVSPDTGTGAVRNDKGQIVGTTGFVTL